MPRKLNENQLRLDRFDENETYWRDLTNALERDTLTLQYITDDLKNSTLNYRALKLIDSVGDNYGHREEYNSFTNVFDAEILAIDKYFSLVFGLEENLNIIATTYQISYQSTGIAKPSRSRAQIEFEINSFSEFVAHKRCIYGNRFLFRERMWQVSAKYTQNSNLSVYLHLCDRDLREGEVYSVRASIRPVEINAGHYSCCDLFEKRLECGEFSVEKRSNGFSKYYFSSVRFF